MNANEAVEELRLFVIGHGLPKIDMALYGVKCPYCGKTDRIKPLEHPDELTGKIDSEAEARYAEYWNLLSGSNGSLGVCKFCQNPLKLNNPGGAEQLLD